MVTFGLDISHHQSASLNLADCKKQGFEFVIIKATEGASFVDPAFAANLKEARSAGLRVAAYHYVKSDSSAVAQVANVARVVPKDVPVIPDIEANSGGVALAKAVVTGLQAAGYKVPLTYLPRWYWQQLGSPSLVGLPSLWSSRYPDNQPDTVLEEYKDVPASYWNGYGGLGVKLLQFTSSGLIQGYSGKLDFNAFLGTVEELDSLFSGKRLEAGMPEMYDKVKFTLPDGGVIEMTHSEILARLLEVHLISALAPNGETVHDAVWKNRAVLAKLAGDLSDDEVKILAAINQVKTPVAELSPEDADRFAAAVLAQIPAQVQDAVRQAFARAGEPPSK